MNDLTINLKSGDLFLNNFIFKIDTEKNYLNSIEHLDHSSRDKVLEVNGFKKYGGYDVCFAGVIFGPEFVYKAGELYSKYFMLGEGCCVINGWDATEQDQKKDRVFLTNKISNFLDKKPDKKLKSRDVFIYEWGEIVVSITHRDYYVMLNFNYY